MGDIKISVDFKGLEKTIEQIAVDKLSGAAKKIADELTKFSEHAILGFYDHYQPIKYKRQGGLSQSYSRVYKNAHGNIFYGGVDLHPGGGSYFGWSGGRRVSVDSEWPSALAIFNGMHGNVEAFSNDASIPPRMSPSPFELIEKKRDEILNNIDMYING